eukprot:GHVS01031678.1.p1 GENE.GHVS01031678.1~~GHVS01031678.1.p1  ORF type:complete len:313 (+),score=15.90 GHVS01031678.1:103-1041(+)
MLSTALGCGLICGTLVLFALVVAVVDRANLKQILHPTESLISSRSSSSWFPLGCSLFASCMGSWVMFIPPQLGALYGMWCVLLYIVAVCVPMLTMIWLGPAMRRIVGEQGFAVSDFVRMRYGRWVHLVMSLISLFSMWTSLTGELAFAGRAMTTLVEGLPPLGTIIPVVVVTLSYTIYSGLTSSILTDVIQGVLILFLASIGLSVAFAHGNVSFSEWNSACHWLKGANEGVIAGLVMVVSFAPAFFIDQSAWQRVWAARSYRDIRLGFLLAAVLIVPIMMLFGAAGIVASAAYGDADLPMPLFDLTEYLAAP